MAGKRLAATKASEVWFSYSDNCTLANGTVFHSVCQVWLSSGPPEFVTFSYCAWSWNRLISWTYSGSKSTVPWLWCRTSCWARSAWLQQSPNPPPPSLLVAHCQVAHLQTLWQLLERAEGGWTGPPVQCWPARGACTAEYTADLQLTWSQISKSFLRWRSWQQLVDMSRLNWTPFCFLLVNSYLAANHDSVRAWENGSELGWIVSYKMIFLKLRVLFNCSEQPIWKKFTRKKWLFSALNSWEFKLLHTKLSYLVLVPEVRNRP